MYYTEQDMLQQIPSDATPFERQMCRAMAFGDNLALSASMVTMTAALLKADESSEANENNSTSMLSTDTIAMGLFASLSNIIHEV